MSGRHVSDGRGPWASQTEEEYCRNVRRPKILRPSRKAMRSRIRSAKRAVSLNHTRRITGHLSAVLSGLGSAVLENPPLTKVNKLSTRPILIFLTGFTSRRSNPEFLELYDADNPRA